MRLWLLWLLALLVLPGCLTIKLNCPSDGVAFATSNGPDLMPLAQGLISLLGKGALVATPRATASPVVETPSYGSIEVQTLAVLGAHSLSCGLQPPSAK